MSMASSYSALFTTWIASEYAVLCYVRDGENILLMQKKRGLGAGKINAPGGRIEKGETPTMAVIRETQEEVCIIPHEPALCGRLRFHFISGYNLETYVFLVDTYSGYATETEEAIPFWCPIAMIPYHNMWEDDILWMPSMLNGDIFVGDFVFNTDIMIWHDVVLQNNIKIPNLWV